MKKSCVILIILLMIAIILLSSCRIETLNSTSNETDVVVSQNESKTIKLKKDDSITNEMRKEYFDFVAEYGIHTMPIFSEGETPDINDMIIYTAYLNQSNLIQDGYQSRVTSEQLIKAANEKFDITYNIGEQETFSVNPEGVRELPLSELISYNEEKADNATAITAVTAMYYIWPLNEYDSQNNYPEKYSSVYNNIISGNADAKDVNYILEFKYLTKDGKTPQKFTSVKCFTNDTADFKAFFG